VTRGTENDKQVQLRWRGRRGGNPKIGGRRGGCKRRVRVREGEKRDEILGNKKDKTEKRKRAKGEGGGDKGG